MKALHGEKGWHKCGINTFNCSLCEILIESTHLNVSLLSDNYVKHTFN